MQADLINSGERNYTRLIGDNGPLVFYHGWSFHGDDVDFDDDDIDDDIFNDNDNDDDDDDNDDNAQVYPAGHAWIHYALHQLTDAGWEFLPSSLSLSSSSSPCSSSL